jgi:hypothetical protein
MIVLLFVFWYCHKRGREVRLEKEASSAGQERALKEDESDVDASDNAASSDDEERAILEAALRKRQPHQSGSS